MKETLRGVLIFYRSFALFSILISLSLWLLAGLPLGRDLVRFFPLYFFLKLATDTLIWYYVKRFEPGVLFFYFNLGISRRRLFISAFVIDMFLFVLFLFLVNVLL